MYLFIYLFVLIRHKALLCLMQLNVKDCSCSTLWGLFFLCPPPFLFVSFSLSVSLCVCFATPFKELHFNENSVGVFVCEWGEGPWSTGVPWGWANQGAAPSPIGSAPPPV